MPVSTLSEFEVLGPRYVTSKIYRKYLKTQLGH